jgi:hypothetical protein
MRGRSLACRITGLLPLLIATAGLVTPAPASAATATPSAAFITHHGHFWSWAGPRNWHAAYGAYGITVVSGDGDLSLDLGFSSILCTAAPSVNASANRYFKRQRQIIKRGPTSIVGAGRIHRIRGRGLGPNYFRQSLNIATRANGKRYLGQVALDYQVPDPIYCYRRSLSLVAPARGFGGSLNTLLRVYGSLAYFGPGAPIDPDD